MHSSVTRPADLWEVVVSPEGVVCQGAVARLEGAEEPAGLRHVLRFTQFSRQGRVVETVDESRTWVEHDEAGGHVVKRYTLRGLQQSQALAFDGTRRPALVYVAHGHSETPGDRSRYFWLRYAVREGDDAWRLETVREWRIRSWQGEDSEARGTGAAPGEPAVVPRPQGLAEEGGGEMGLPVPPSGESTHLWCSSSLTFGRGGQPIFLLLLTPSHDAPPPCLWDAGGHVGGHDSACLHAPCRRGETPCSPTCLSDSELHLFWRTEQGWQDQLIDTGVRHLGSGRHLLRPGFLHFGHDGQPSVAYARLGRSEGAETRELILAQRAPDGRWRKDALSNPAFTPSGEASEALRFRAPSLLVGAMLA